MQIKMLNQDDFKTINQDANSRCYKCLKIPTKFVLRKRLETLFFFPVNANYFQQFLYGHALLHRLKSS